MYENPILFIIATRLHLIHRNHTHARAQLLIQSIIWGNFGKMDKKNFMGIAQISIDDLELGETVISWYKLFLPSSLQTLPSKSLRHTLLSNSTESFTNTNNS